MSQTHLLYHPNPYGACLRQTPRYYPGSPQSSIHSPCRRYPSLVGRHKLKIRPYNVVLYTTAPNESAQWRSVISIKPFRIILFEFLYQFIIGQPEVAVSGIEENIFIYLFSLLVGKSVRGVGHRIRHKDIKKACSRDYQFLTLVASHDTAGIIHALVVDFSCNHVGIVFMPPAPLTAQGAVGESVYVNSYEVSVVNQQIVVAVATAAILLA